MPWVEEEERERIVPPPRVRVRTPRAPVVRTLLVANFLVFGLELLYGDAVLVPFALWPLGHGFQPWQLLTSAFLHGGLLHIGTNMYGLWMFGSDVERILGSRRFLKLYFTSVLAAAVAQLVVTAGLSQVVPTLGASGGIFGVLVAFAMIFPERRILLIFPPIPMRARTFVLIYAAIELFAGVTGAQAGVAHFAHLGGLFGGWLLMRGWMRPQTGEEL